MKNSTHSAYENATLLLKKSFLLFTFFFASLGLIAQTVTTDKADYSPGETAYASGEGWAAFESIVLNVHEEPVYHDDVITNIVADASGNFSNVAIYDFEQHDLGSSYTLTATGQSNGPVYAYFTDGAPDIEAWLNLPTAAWSGGTTVQQSNAKYGEGDALPFQYTQEAGKPDPELIGGETYCLTLRYDYSANPNTAAKFIDYLQTYDETQTGVTPFTDLTGIITGIQAIPTDPELVAALLTQTPGVFTLFNIVPGSLVFGQVAGDVLGAGETAYWPYVLEAGSGGKVTKRLRICFEVAGTGPQDVGIAFGGHLAEETFWGEGNGAGNFPGASPQFRINLAVPNSTSDDCPGVNCPDATSDQNINISPSAIVPLPRIDFITKDAVPNNLQDFNFTGTLGNFTLDDDSGVLGADDTN